MKLKKPSKNKLTSKLLREMVAKQLQTTQPTDNQISNAFIADLISKTIKEVEGGDQFYQQVISLIKADPDAVEIGEDFQMMMDHFIGQGRSTQEAADRYIGLHMEMPSGYSSFNEAEEAAEGGEEKQQGGKDVQKAVDKLESSQMAPLFKKISNADEFEGLFKEFVNLAAQHPSIKPTAVKNILIKFAKQVASQGKQDPNKEGEQDK